MVWKNAPIGLNTGNTVRKFYMRLINRSISKKTIDISNGKSHVRNLNYENKREKLFEELIGRIGDRAENELYKNIDNFEALWTIKDALRFFMDLDEELCVFGNKFQPEEAEVVSSRVFEELHNLLQHQNKVISGGLQTGHDSKQAFSVTVTIKDESLFLNKSKILCFRSYTDYNDVRRDREIARKKELQRIWHNQSFRDVQRKTELPRLKGRQLGWQYKEEEDYP